MLLIFEIEVQMSRPTGRRGGILFKHLLYDGKTNYVCDKDCLVKIKSNQTYYTAMNQLVHKINETLYTIEKETRRLIEKFYIGRTHIKRKMTKGGKLNSQDPRTWNKEGIGSSWAKHKRGPRGRDGLIVIAVVQEHQVPEDIVNNDGNLTDQNAYTLALEQSVILHYTMQEKDPACANKTTDTDTILNGCAGYAIYIAFRFEDHS